MKPKLPIVSIDKTIYYPLKRVILLLADGTCTIVHTKEKDGTVTKHTQSFNLGSYCNLLHYQFLRPCRSYLVNQRYVHGIGRNPSLYLSLPKGFRLTVPKDNWKTIKQQLNRQLVIPFDKKDGSLDEKGASFDQKGSP